MEIPPKEDQCNPGQVPEVYNPHFKDLTISGGRHPVITAAGDQPNFSNYIYAATTFQNLHTEWGIGQTDDTAITQVYARALDFPTIDDIFNHRGCEHPIGLSDMGMSLSSRFVHKLTLG